MSPDEDKKSRPEEERLFVGTRLDRVHVRYVTPSNPSVNPVTHSFLQAGVILRYISGPLDS